MPLPTSMSHQIITSVNAYLLEVLRTEIAANDSTRAGLVRVGLLQDSPIKTGITVLTYYNDPDDEAAWRHALVGESGGFISGTHPLPFEVGGGSMWYRRFTTKVEMYFLPGTTRALAEQLAAIISSRAEKAIIDAPIPQAPDSFGEEALQYYLASSTNIEAGGIGQFIFHAKIWWSALCERN